MSDMIEPRHLDGIGLTEWEATARASLREALHLAEQTDPDAARADEILICGGARARLFELISGVLYSLMHRISQLEYQVTNLSTKVTAAEEGKENALLTARSNRRMQMEQRSQIVDHLRAAAQADGMSKPQRKALLDAADDVLNGNLLATHGGVEDDQID